MPMSPRPQAPSKRVANGMHQDIRVGMPEQSLFVGDVDSAQNEIAAFDQPVEIEADAGSEIWVRSFSYVIVARNQSSG